MLSAVFEAESNTAYFSYLTDAQLERYILQTERYFKEHPEELKFLRALESARLVMEKRITSGIT